MPGLAIASLPHHIELARAHYTLRHLTQIRWRCVKAVWIVWHLQPLDLDGKLVGDVENLSSVDILIADH